MERMFWSVLGLVVVGASGASVHAQTSAPGNDSAKRSRPAPAVQQRGSAEPSGPAKQHEPAPMTPDREAAALTFARLHHPELAELLSQLKKHNRPEYRRAVRDLFQARERLARIEERSPERYEFALSTWKINSRIRLLAARMARSDDPALEAELQAALEERLDLRLQQLRFERERVEARLQKIDETMSDLEQDREAAVFRDLQRVKRSLGPSSRRPNRTRDRDTDSPEGE